MLLKTSLLILLGSGVFTPAVAPQETPRVIVVDSAFREVRRTAARLRIPVAQLRRARAALEEASDVARETEPASPEPFGPLGRLWIDLNRPAAPAKLAAVLGALRSRAEGTEDVALYHGCSAAAQPLLSALAEVDLERAVALVRSWPVPRGETIRPDGSRRNLGGYLRSQSYEQLAYQDPDRALALMEGLGGAEGASYDERGRIAALLHRLGRKDEALRLVDGVGVEFARRKPDAAGVRDYQGFVASLAQIDPDRALSAFQTLGSAAAAGVVTQHVGETTLSLTQSEAAQLNALRSFWGRPELALKALRGAPALKAKLDAVGGLDRVLMPIYRDPAPIRLIEPGSAPMAGNARADSPLIEELRGKALKDPGFVRQVLAQKTSDPEALMALAQRVREYDPELASLALERAAVLLPGVQPAALRARQIEEFLHLQHQIEGEVDPAVFKLGFLAVDELREDHRAREAEQAAAAASAPRRRAGVPANLADTLEVALVAGYARVDFDAALAFARTLPDAQRLAAFVQMAQMLRSSF